MGINLNVFGAVPSGLNLLFFYTFLSCLLPSSMYRRLEGTLGKAERVLHNTKLFLTNSATTQSIATHCGVFRENSTSKYKDSLAQYTINQLSI